MPGTLLFLIDQTRRMRADLLASLQTLPECVLHTAPPEYGQGSVLSTLTHVADCYGGWVGRTLLEDDWDFAPYPEPLPELTARFERVDALLHRALTCTRMQTGEPFTVTGMAGTTRQVTARWLVLHPVTHEFHHKGQVVTLLRQQGSPVTVDLDLPPPGGW